MTNPTFCHRCRRYLTRAEAIERWCDKCRDVPACERVEPKKVA